jgi:hypothetical protein
MNQQEQSMISNRSGESWTFIGGIAGAFVGGGLAIYSYYHGQPWQCGSEFALAITATLLAARNLNPIEIEENVFSNIRR